MYDVGAIVGRIVLQDTYTGPLKKAEAASTQFESTVKKTSSTVDRESDRMEQSLDDVGDAASSLSGVLAGLGTGALFAGFTASLLSLSQAGAELEQTFVSYKTLLGGSAEATQELVGELNQLANITPYTNQEILKAGKQMLAFGARAEDVSEILTVVGDVASGTGKNFNELALIYGKAMTAGVVQAEELNQLTKAGIPIVKVLAEQFGVAESQVKKLGSEGKIGFKDLEKAFQSMTSEGGLFFNMMEEQSKTFAGLLSTLQGNIGSLAAEIGLTVNDILKPALELLVSLSGNVLEMWQNLPQPVKDGAVAFAMAGVAISGIVIALPFIIAGIKAVGAAFTAAFVTNPIGLIIAGVSFAIAGLVAITLKMRREWYKFATYFKPITDALSDIRDGFMSISNAIDGSAFGDFIKEISGAADDIDLFATVVKAALFPVIAIISNLIASFRALAIVVNGFVDNGGALVSLLKEIAVLSAAMTMPGGLIAWASQGGAGRLQDAFANMGGGMSDSFAQARDVIVETNKQIADSFDDIITKNKDAKTEVTDTTKELVQEVVKAGEAYAFPAGDTLADEFARGWTAGLSAIGQATIGGMLFDSINESAEKIGDALQTVFDGFVDNMALGAELAVAKIEDTIAKVDFIGEVALTAAKKRHEEELAALEASENAKIQALRDAQVERFALIDEEFAKRKEQMDAEFALLLEQERMKFELRLLELEQRSADEEQARLARQVMEEDWRKYVESLQQQHTQNILDAETQKNDQIQAETQSNADAIAAAEQAKADAITKIKEEQAAKEKALEKQQLLVKSVLEYQAFQADKKAKLASAGISYAMAVMEAVRGGAALAASFPPFTVPLGLAFTASMIGLATGTYNMTRGIIAASNYTPPAALFAEEGGTIVGPRHSMGGVMVNAEGGETFLSRRLTADLEDYISDDRQFVPITFAPGSIVVQGNMDASMVDRLAIAIAARIEQRRY